MDSILNSVKKILGIEILDTSFDGELIIHINSTLNIAFQLGFGEVPIIISGDTEKWSDFISELDEIEMVKSYVGLKIKKIFDPPTSGAGMDSLDNLIKEFEWRINVGADKTGGVSWTGCK